MKFGHEHESGATDNSGDGGSSSSSSSISSSGGGSGNIGTNPRSFITLPRLAVIHVQRLWENEHAGMGQLRFPAKHAACNQASAVG